MKKTHKEELYIKQDNLTDQLFDTHSIFFDIETTGFSPNSSSLYMIGCAVDVINTFTLINFLLKILLRRKLYCARF